MVRTNTCPLLAVLRCGFYTRLPATNFEQIAAALSAPRSECPLDVPEIQLLCPVK
jgi:hypothetical protein